MVSLVLKPFIMSFSYTQNTTAKTGKRKTISNKDKSDKIARLLKITFNKSALINLFKCYRAFLLVKE